MKLGYLFFLTLLTYTVQSHGEPSLSNSPLSMMLASKLGISTAHTDNTSLLVEWPGQPKPPRFMYKLYHKVLHRIRQDPTRAINLLGFGNTKAFANSIQIVYPLSVKNGIFGHKYEMKVFHFKISLLNDNLTKGYLHIHNPNSSHKDLVPLSIFVVSNGKTVNLVSNEKSHSKNFFILPLSKIENIATDGILTFVIMSSNALVENYSANLILYAQDAQASTIYWTHSKRRRRRSTPDATPPPTDYTSTQCQNHHLYISFREIGWSDFIKYPDGYNVNYCYGTCPIPLLSHHNVTNHAILQNSIHYLSKPTIPQVCCAPTELSPITLIYADPVTRRLVMKVYMDMQVIACGCL